MRTLNFTLVTLALLMTTCGFSQITPEQKKQQEKAERMRDSIMNSAMFKKAMQQAQQAQDKMPPSIMEKSKKVDAQRRKEKENRRNNPSNKKAGHLDNMMITKSTDKQFDGWVHGEAEIFVVARSYDGTETFEHKVGEFNAAGTFDMINHWPEIPTEASITKFFVCHPEGQETQYTNPNTYIINGYLEVRKGGEKIGSLHVATSRQAVKNHSPAGFYRGDPGFYAELFFVTEAVSISGECTYDRNATDHAEIEQVLGIRDIYDIHLNQGWNFVKHEVVQSKNVGNIPYYTVKKLARLGNNDSSGRWIFRDQSKN